MSQADELLALIEALAQGLDTKKAEVEAARSKVDEVKGIFAEVGAESSIARIEVCDKELETLQSTYNSLSEPIEKARAAAMDIKQDGQSGSGGNSGASWTSESSGGLTSPISSTAKIKAPEMAKPPEDVAKYLGTNIQDFKAEHQDVRPNPDGSYTTTVNWNGTNVEITMDEHNDSPDLYETGHELVDNSQEGEGLSKSRRAFRTMVRNVDDFQGAVKDQAKTMEGIIKHDPASGDTKTEILINTDQMPHLPSIHQAPSPSLNPVDVAVHTVILGIGIIEASTRARRRRKSSS